MEIILQILLLILGFGLLVKGADWFVDGAAGVAEKSGIPQLVIGLTIVAMGTSAPEAAVSITAALKGNAGITIGNIVGSNILNVLIILGLSAVIVPIAVAKSTVKVEMPYMILITFLLLGLGISGNEIRLWEGVVLWVAFLAYLGYLFWMVKKDKNQQEEVKKKEESIWKLLIMVIIGIVCIMLGSDFAVDAATVIAKEVGMSERLIGLTIVALGTSLPELVTSVSAAMKGKADIAIGNIVGSNIFNILFVVGTTALITPVVFESKFIIDTIISAAAGILLWLCVFRDRKLSRAGGAIMLVGYAAYFVYIMR